MAGELIAGGREAAADEAFAEQVPEPGRWWIRFRPRRWPGTPGPWTDLAAGELGRAREATASLERLAPPSPCRDDLVYLPPVAAGRGAERDRLAAAHAAAGTPLLTQLVPGEEPPAGAVAVYDLLGSLLASDLGALAGVARGSWVAWPLVAGVTDSPGVVEAGLARLSAAGARGAVPVVLDLRPAERRSLAAERDAATFAALFHGRPPRERIFARAAAAAGLAPFFARPLPAGPAAGHRTAAAALAVAAELWLRLDRPLGEGQALLRAARWAERGEHDLRSLWREGNLRLLDWLDGAARQVVEEVFAGRRPALLAALEEAYLAPQRGEGPP